MTVRVNKPSFNLREKLSELTSKFGLKGTELARAETIQDARNLISAGRKNMVINGDMRINQRDNAGNVSSSNTYQLDRWVSRNNSDGTLYLTSQQNSTSGPPGFRSWMLAQCDGTDTTIGSSQYVRIQQYVEGYNCIMDWGLPDGNTDYLTASFWVQTNKAGIYCFSISDGDDSPVYTQEYVINYSGIWTKIELTIPPPSEGTWRGNDLNTGMRMTWCLMAGSGQTNSGNTWTSSGMATSNQVNFMDNANNNFYLTGVQLEVGRNATEFEYRSFGEELALCQRYYIMYANAGSKPICTGATYGTNRAFGVVHLPTTMRSNPTIIATSGPTNFYYFANGNGGAGFSTFVLQETSENAVTLETSNTLSATDGAACWMRANTGAIAMSAEL